MDATVLCEQLHNVLQMIDHARGLRDYYCQDDVLNPSSCVACGCTDQHACAGGCWWLELDREHHIGLCSSCERYRGQWAQWRAKILAGECQREETLDGRVIYR